MSADRDAGGATDAESVLAQVELLGEQATEESAAELHRLEAGPLAKSDKKLKRAIRRSLYRLAQRGIAGARAESVPATPATPLQSSTDAEGFVSPIDPTGDRLFWIIKPKPGGGIWHLSTVVNEPAGLRESVLAETTRKGLRTLRDELGKRHGLRMVEVDARYVDWIASEGFERAQKNEAGVPDSAKGFGAQRLQLFPFPAAPAPSPIEGVFDASETRADSSLLEKAVALFENELRFWLMPPTEITGAMERVKAMRDSPIVLDRLQQQSRIEEIAEDAVVEAFTGERKASWRRRLEEMALVLAKLGKRDEGRALYATALALAAGEQG
ncbi:MAG: hypothetical protein ACREQJ_13575, partial [Candidatus Binatia bacterium]